MTNDLEAKWCETFGKCSPFVRDTTLPPVFLEKYQIGLLLRDPTFCDASYKIGGFVAPDRFLIFSSNARTLDQDALQPWGLCIWPTGRCFRIIDKIIQQYKFQITLLEIPEELLHLFEQRHLRKLEQHFVKQAHKIFEENVNAVPVPELNTEDWRQKLVAPIGINDQGDYFPLWDETDSPDDAMSIKMIGFSPLEPGDQIEMTDEIRQGDVVYFERLGPKELTLKRLLPENAGSHVGKKYRIVQDSRPGLIILTEETD